MSTLLDELLVETRVNLAGLMSGLGEAEAKTAQTRAKLREMLTVPTGGAGLAADESKQASALAGTTTAIERKIAMMRAESAAISQGIAAGQSYRQIQTEITAATKEAEFASRGLGAQSGILARAFADSQNTLRGAKDELKEHVAWHENLGKTLATQGDRLKSMGTSLTMGVTAPLALVAAASAKAALGFDEIMTKVVTLGGVSPQMANAWRGQVLSMAPQVGAKPNDLAEGLYRIASSGLEDKSQAPDILRTVAKGSALGLGDIATTAETITSAMNAYSESGLTAAKATGILVQAVTEGKAEAGAFAPIMGRVGAMANEWGISFAQVAASIAAMTRLGLNPDEAATASRRMFIDLASPKGQQADLLKALHISAEELRQTLRGPQGVLDALDLLRSKTGGDPDLTRRLFPDVRGMVGAMSLSGSHFNEARQVFGDVTAAGPNTLDEMFGVRQQSTSFQMKQAGAAIDVASIRLGTDLLKTLGPQITEISKDIEGLARAFSSLPDPVKNATVHFLEFAASLGPVLYLLGNLMRLGPLGIGAGVGVAIGTAINALIDKARHNVEIANMTGSGEHGAAGALLGAYAGLNAPPALSNFRSGSSFTLGGGVGYAQTAMGPVPHIPTAREQAAAERLARERGTARTAAEQAEAAVSHTAAGFTGDPAEFEKQAIEKVEAARAESIRKAKGDQQQIVDINRKAAADIEKIHQDAEKVFVEFENRKLQAAERTANAGVRAAEVETHGQTQLIDIQMRGVQRQIQFAELRKEPIQRILELYGEEMALTRQKSALEIDGASKELKLIQDKEAAQRAVLAADDAEIAKLKAGPLDDVTKGRIAEIDDQRKKIQDDILDSVTQEQKVKDDTAKAQEQSLITEFNLRQKIREIDPTLSQAIQDKLGESTYGANKEYANIAVDGIHNIGHAMTDMLNKGKLDWASLDKIALDTLTKIENKMQDRAIDKGLALIFGDDKKQAGGGGGVGAAAGGLSSLWYGPNGQDPLANGLNSLGSGGGLGGLMSWFGGGSMPGLSLAKPGGFDASSVLWNFAGMGGTAGGAGSAGGGGIMSLFSGLFGGAGGAAGAGGGGLMSMLSGAGSGIMSLLGSAGGGIGSLLSFLPALFLHKGGMVGDEIPRHHMGALEIGGLAFGGLSLLNMLGGGQGIMSLLMGAAGGLGTAAGGIMGGLDNFLGLGGATGAWAATGGGGGLLGMLGFHSGGIVPRYHSGLAPDESLSILQAGEMVLSRGDTTSLLSGGSARIPSRGGYRPSARIFMTDMSHATSRSTGSQGGGGTHIHNWTVNASNLNERGYSKNELERQASTGMSRASHRMN